MHTPPTPREIELKGDVIALKMLLMNLMTVLAAEEAVRPSLGGMRAVISQHDVTPALLPLSEGWGDAHRQALSSRILKASTEILDGVDHQLAHGGR